MYKYDDFDRTFVAERVAQFRDQVERRLAGELSEDEFKPLRLTNGLYLQLHAYMLRIAIPYGTLSSRQMRTLAMIARRWDRGYGHFTTRQNIQFNWIKLVDTPDILEALAEVEMHGLQTSGNCIRNVTADHWAGVAADEVEDPRVWAEILRQWSSLHPEFTFLPRKFKIAVSGGLEDRAAVRVHDIGLRLHRNQTGEVGFEVIVGGGLGRTPFVGKTLKEFLPKQHLLSYLEATLRTYNRFGRRDNLYKARIKILVHEIGIETMREEVEAEWVTIKDGPLSLPEETVAAIAAHFAPPAYPVRPARSEAFEELKRRDRDFVRWASVAVAPHRAPGHAIVTLSLKPEGGAPGDLTADQMDAVADLADRFSLGELRLSHVQNVILPNVALDDLPELWREIDALDLATPNIGLATDIIACPGLDYCALANARSIPVAQRISIALADLEKLQEIGPLAIKISGCINACGHHHVGDIGILGVDKHGEEFYQITLGGSAGVQAKIGQIVGKGVSFEEVADAIQRIVATYLDLRQAKEETFADAYRRLGPAPFKERLYAVA